MRTYVFAVLLAGLQPHRRGLLQDQGSATGCAGSDASDPGRGDGTSALDSNNPRRHGLLRALRLSSSSRSATVKRAVSSYTLQLLPALFNVPTAKRRGLPPGVRQRSYKVLDKPCFFRSHLFF